MNTLPSDRKVLNKKAGAESVLCPLVLNYQRGQTPMYHRGLTPFKIGEIV